MTIRCEEILQQIAARRDDLVRLGVRSLALFGSAARDEAGPGSDIDLVVEFEEPATFDRYVELSFLLEDLLGCRIDLLTRRSPPAFMRGSIEKDLRYVPGLSPVPG
jgi:predicted nucleotidyltransferase